MTEDQSHPQLPVRPDMADADRPQSCPCPRRNDPASPPDFIRNQFLSATASNPHALPLSSAAISYSSADRLLASLLLQRERETALREGTRDGEGEGGGRGDNCLPMRVAEGKRDRQGNNVLFAPGFTPHFAPSAPRPARAVPVPPPRLSCRPNGSVRLPPPVGFSSDSLDATAPPPMLPSPLPLASFGWRMGTTLFPVVPPPHSSLSSLSAGNTALSLSAGARMTLDSATDDAVLKDETGSDKKATAPAATAGSPEYNAARARSLSHGSPGLVPTPLPTKEEIAVAVDGASQAARGAIIADDTEDILDGDDDRHDDGDGDSSSDAGYESDVATTASTSVTSSAWDFTFENGRRYHKFREGSYNFPNDDMEQEREDMKHDMIRRLCQQLHFAPITDSTHHILDIGTGTGIWAIEMADMYPSADVLGIDLSPIQPSWVPPNVRFMVDDVESAWLHPFNYFDYIHSRHTVMAIKDWDKLFRRSFEHLKPGGWMEIQEIHHVPMSNNKTLTSSHPVSQYWDLVGQGLSALGVANFHAFSTGGQQMADRMRHAGFINVTERVFHLPIGTWPQNKLLKAVGVLWRRTLLEGVQAIALGPLMRGLQWERERLEAFLVSVRRGYDDHSTQMFMPFICIYGQKPQ